jgi:hypothetical protein
MANPYTDCLNPLDNIPTCLGDTSLLPADPTQQKLIKQVNALNAVVKALIKEVAPSGAIDTADVASPTISGTTVTF